MKKGNLGFTLVELIIVIAILAILSTGAIAGYSVYVEQANKAADEAMMQEVATALQLAYYSGLDVEDGYVILSCGEDADCKGTGVAQAMEDAFGENWKAALQLKNNWLSSFSASNYSGNAMNIIKNIDILTDKLGDVVYTLGGTSFNNYISGLGIERNDSNKAAIADAAVFYIADQISSMDNANKQRIVDSMPSMTKHGDPTQILADLYAQGMTPVAAAATLYALAEGLCTELNDTEVREVFDGAMSNIGDATYSDSGKAAEAVLNALLETQKKANDKGLNISGYFENGQAGKDMSAYFDLMTSVAPADQQIKESFGQTNCFENLSGLVTTVTEGGVLIYLQVNDGVVSIVNTAKAA